MGEVLAGSETRLTLSWSTYIAGIKVEAVNAGSLGWKPRALGCIETLRERERKRERASASKSVNIYVAKIFGYKESWL